jgi:DeoR/GlpR family transcriptional regulator of sugar metabolism
MSGGTTVSNGEPLRTPISADDRRARIVELVVRQGFCTITELSAAHDVSDMTIRRDLRILTQQGQLRGVHGGVTVLQPTAMVGTDYRARVARMTAVKHAIAERALEFVPASGAIAIDAGTTTMELANVLPADSRIKVVTQSLPVINALLPHEYIDVICLGGTLHSDTQSFAGPATVAAINELRVRTLFLAASGLRANGVYCGNDFDAITKRTLVSAADEVILLTDSTKFSISAMVRACALNDLHRVITDDGISEENLAMLTELDIKVIVVPASTVTSASL